MAKTNFQLRRQFQTNIRASEGAGTTTLTSADSRHQVFNLSASRQVNLPTTGIVTGEKVILENRTAFDLVVAASNGSEITLAAAGSGSSGTATIQIGKVELVALVDSPTTPADWKVIDVFEHQPSTVLSLTWTGNGGIFSSTQVTPISFIRHNSAVIAQISSIFATADATPAPFQDSVEALPTRFRPNSNRYQSILEYNGSTGVLSSQVGAVLIFASSGLIRIGSTPSFGTNWSASNNNGWEAFTINYRTRP